MAIISFLGMGEHASYHDGRRLAELASNTACLPNSGPVLTSLFHVNAVKTFSTGLVSAMAFGLIALFALADTIPASLPAGTANFYQPLKLNQLSAACQPPFNQLAGPSTKTAPPAQAIASDCRLTADWFSLLGSLEALHVLRGFLIKP